MRCPWQTGILSHKEKKRRYFNGPLYTLNVIQFMNWVDLSDKMSFTTLCKAGLPFFLYLSLIQSQISSPVTCS